jgi:hypothetical protein
MLFLLIHQKSFGLARKLNQGSLNFLSNMIFMTVNSNRAHQTLFKINLLFKVIYFMLSPDSRKRWEYAARYGFIQAASIYTSYESIKPLAAVPLFLAADKPGLTRNISPESGYSSLCPCSNALYLVVKGNR